MRKTKLPEMPTEPPSSAASAGSATSSAGAERPAMAAAPVPVGARRLAAPVAAAGKKARPEQSNSPTATRAAATGKMTEPDLAIAPVIGRACNICTRDAGKSWRP
eukprot:CAMPEP_0115223362 /NCGR_PEP_ID=MMETSP0270-20121206/29011_1 /TAXON_ID=71861 /ORGANISM="Scrippsiella trochoidea, Strain CCMP3099" /LENGTH=104 /DNA_ID=CAMNT_0002637621 /DNA_START=308 /DNA_END=619 /DNA_ORIENTATION=-